MGLAFRLVVGCLTRLDTMSDAAPWLADLPVTCEAVYMNEVAKGMELS
jgi:hypothetical protein